MGKTKLQAGERHHWRFARSGGVDQVILRDGDDIRHLRELDLKLWMALAMPVSGTALDARSATLLDADGDGRIRPPEILAAADWLCAALKDPGRIIESGDDVPLEWIKDPTLLASARLLLSNLGKPDTASISVADVAEREKAFAGTLFNGDGVIPPSAASDPETRKAIEDIMSAMGSVADRGGEQGLDAATLKAFAEQAASWLAWYAKGDDPAISPLGREKSSAALASTRRVAAKVDDFFTRCRLAAFNGLAETAMNKSEEELRALGADVLSAGSEKLAALPLARVAAGASLPLSGPVNPAWASALAALASDALRPLLPDSGDSLDERQWEALRSALASHGAWMDQEPSSPVAALGHGRLSALLGGSAIEGIMALIRKDEELAGESAAIAELERLVLLRRDLYPLLCNYVNFSAFYGGKGALFQAGTLFLDARSCSLCVEVADDSRHVALAALSGAFLAYCDLSRPGGAKKKIVAAITDGAADNLMVGRNGVFYDRAGLDWDATVTKVIANPISVREAFWSPYKKLARMIEEQIAKRAQAGDAAATAKLDTAAATVASADKTPPKAEAPKKLDLGTIALVGTAIGGISALVAGIFDALFGLGWFLPLGVLGVFLLISGPSMVLASLKLRKRNLAPILDANGWAINTQARINIPFGSSLTDLAALPPGTLPSLNDPYAEKKKPWKLYLWLFILLLLVGAGVTWRFGWADKVLPESARWTSVFKPAPVQQGSEITEPAGR